MSWGRLGEAVHNAALEPPHRRDLAQVMDRHIAWQETGTGPGHALSLPALFAVVRLIASNIDQLDLTVDGGPVPDWLRLPRSVPGAQLDQGDLIQYTVSEMALRGKAFWLCERTDRGWRLNAVHHGSVGVQASSFGTVGLSYTFNGEPIERLSYNGYGQERALIHIPYLVTADSPEGTSPAVEAWPSIAGYLAVEKQAATLLDGGTHSGGRLETDHDLTAESARRYRDTWIENRRKGLIPVLGAGLRYANDVISPRDATWIESRQANAMQVASMYGVPNDMLSLSRAGGASSLSYANSQDNNRRFRTNCLEAFTSQIEDAISPLLRAPGRNGLEEQRIRFDYTEWEAAANATPDAEA
jgi:HK97 family phage portal protein